MTVIESSRAQSMPAPPRGLPAQRPVPYEGAEVSISRWLWIGYFVVIGLFGTLFVWAATISIQGAVVAQGQVGLEGNIKTVQHLDGGLVAEIRVRNGDAVNKDDVLIVLDDTTAKANLALYQSRLNDLYGQRARLEAEAAGKAEIAFPEALVEGAKTDPRLAAFLAGQRALLDARQDKFSGNREQLREQRMQAQRQSEGLKRDLAAQEQLLEIASRELDALKPVAAKGLVSRPRMSQLEREVARVTGEIGRLKSEIQRAESTMGETNVKLAQVGRDTLQQVLAELREVQAKIGEQEEEITATRQKQERTTIRAPRAGIVQNLALHTIGGVVQPGAPLLEIVPQDDRMVIEARVAPQDIHQVAADQKAWLRFATLNARFTPEIEGNVVAVSGSSTFDKDTRTSFYVVTIETGEGAIKSLGEKNRIVPGMPVEVHIQTTERTVLSFFMRPLWDAVRRTFVE